MKHQKKLMGQNPLNLGQVNNRYQTINAGGADYNSSSRNQQYNQMQAGSTVATPSIPELNQQDGNYAQEEEAVYSNLAAAKQGADY